MPSTIRTNAKASNKVSVTVILSVIFCSYDIPKWPENAGLTVQWGSQSKVQGAENGIPSSDHRVKFTHNMDELADLALWDNLNKWAASIYSRGEIQLRLDTFFFKTHKLATVQ
jgi:hypothetical protein